MDGKRKGAKRRFNLFVLVIASVVLATLPVFGANSRDDGRKPDLYSDEYYERLHRYASIYPNEIYRYCRSRFGPKLRPIRSCLRKQQKTRDAIFIHAQRQLGSQSRARTVYDDCLNYHPDNGVARIGACVETRLMLHDRVEDDSIERIIYRKCESKWRRSPASSIDTCCAHEGRYYRDNGRLRD